MNNKLYDSYNGFIRGNMFPNLYVPYKNEEPFEIKPANEQADMLTYLDSLEFATIDLNLYLDVHPTDKEVIKIFNDIRKEANLVREDYERLYGPICLTSNSLESLPWAWNNSPWPWEYK